MTGINGPDQTFDLTAQLTSRFREVKEPCSFDSPVSELTIFLHVSFLVSTLFLSKFRSDGPRSVGNFGWDPTISSSSQTLRVFDHSINVVALIIRLRSFDLPELIFCLPINYKLPVLMPSSLLYLPSMTSIRCLLDICQHRLCFHPRLWNCHLSL
jgi:hypothetical protein